MPPLFHGAASLGLVVPQAFPGLPGGELAATVRRAADEHGIEEFDVVVPADPVHRAELVAAVRDTGSRSVIAGGLPLIRAGLSLADEGAARTAAVDLVAPLLDVAVEMGAEAIMVTSGIEDTSPDREARIERLVRSLADLAALAAANAPGVGIRLEPTDTDLTHRQLVGPTALAVDIVDRVAALGATIDLNLDLSHFHQLGDRPREALALAAPHCRHFHLANCIVEPEDHPLRGDRHPPFGYPGSRVGPDELAAVLNDLDDLGYLAPGSIIGVEVTPLSGTDPWATLTEALAAVRSAWDQAQSRR